MNRDNVVYTFSKEKLEECSRMTIRQRLLWLEETNVFINKILGFKKRSEFDERFKVLAEME